MYIAKKPVLDSMPIVQLIDANANKIDVDGVDENIERILLSTNVRRIYQFN